ncbi:MAG: hypothetical protein LCH56_06480 [Proteobacteria bacterium]|nr:hypothetical protein [Pseudomonadota bacterium]
MRKIAAVLGLGFSVILTGCASQAGAQQTFKSPEKEMGQNVEITGYLQYGFENRNLFPSSDWKADFRKKECVPLAIESENQSLVAAAEKLSGSKVTVSGTVQQLLSANDLSTSFCKDVGIMVKAIKPATSK